MQASADQPPNVDRVQCAVVERVQTGPVVVCKGPMDLYTVMWLTPDGMPAMFFVQEGKVDEFLSLLFGERA